MEQNPMNQETFSDEDWLGWMYRKSESKRTKQAASTSISMFKVFCDYQGTTRAND